MALTVFIPLKPYLAQWLVHKHGGELPITLKRNSPESLVLERFLRTQPRKKNIVPKVRAEEGEVPIAVPVFKYKDPRTYNFLPDRGIAAFRQCIRISFAVELWHDLYTVGNVIRRNDVAIREWMAAHGIEYNDTNWNTIAKILQRLRMANCPEGRLSDRNRSSHRKKS